MPCNCKIVFFNKNLNKTLKRPLTISKKKKQLKKTHVFRHKLIIHARHFVHKHSLLHTSCDDNDLNTHPSAHERCTIIENASRITFYR